MSIFTSNSLILLFCVTLVCSTSLVDVNVRPKALGTCKFITYCYLSPCAMAHTHKNQHIRRMDDVEMHHTFHWWLCKPRIFLHGKRIADRFRTNACIQNDLRASQNDIRIAMPRTHEKPNTTSYYSNIALYLHMIAYSTAIHWFVFVHFVVMASALAPQYFFVMFEYRSRHAEDTNLGYPPVPLVWPRFAVRMIILIGT